MLPNFAPNCQRERIVLQSQAVGAWSHRARQKSLSPSVLRLHIYHVFIPPSPDLEPSAASLTVCRVQKYHFPTGTEMTRHTPFP